MKLDLNQIGEGGEVDTKKDGLTGIGERAAVVFLGWVMTILIIVSALLALGKGQEVAGVDATAQVPLRRAE